MTTAGGQDGVGARGRDLLLFRVGRERYATPLANVEEAVDVDVASVQPLPAENPAFRGVFPLRGALTPLYASGHVLGSDAAAGATALVVRGDAAATRAAVIVDDVEDVLTVPEAELRDATAGADTDGVVRGVLHRDGGIIAIVDLSALVAACRAVEGRDRQ